MADLDTLLKPLGISYEDLNPFERESLLEQVNSVDNNTLTIEDMGVLISSMRQSVELELSETPEYIYFIFPNRKHVLLKARMKNYILLEQVFFEDKKRRDTLRAALENLRPKKTS